MKTRHKPWFSISVANFDLDLDVRDYHMILLNLVIRRGEVLFDNSLFYVHWSRGCIRHLDLFFINLIYKWDDEE